MDVVYLVLRLVHILAAVFWVGFAVVAVGFIEPAVKASAPEGPKFMATMMRGPISAALAISGGLTVLGGFALYFRDMGMGQAQAWASTPTGMAFGIGGLFGVAAFVWGLAVTRPASERMAHLGGQMQSAGGPPKPEQIAEMRALQARVSSASRLNAVLLVIALILMVVARAL